MDWILASGSAVVFRSNVNSTSSPSQTTIRSVLLLFPFASAFFCHLPSWIANYVHSFGAQAREAIQKNHMKLASKGNKQKMRFELEVRPSLPTVGTLVRQGARFSGGGSFPRINPRPCERGLRIDVPRYACGHPKTDLFENFSFWKDIRVHVALLFGRLFSHTSVTH